MTIQKGICAECNKEYEYEYNPQFPRKYCFECSAAKKASYSAGDVPKQQTSTAQPVNAPIVKPGMGEVKEPYFNEKLIMGAMTGNKKFNQASMYTAYAKDVFVAMTTGKEPTTIDQAKIGMEQAIALVKQAKEAFE